MFRAYVPLSLLYEHTEVWGSRDTCARRRVDSSPIHCGRRKLVVGVFARVQEGWHQSRGMYTRRELPSMIGLNPFDLHFSYPETYISHLLQASGIYSEHILLNKARNQNISLNHMSPAIQNASRFRELPLLSKTTRAKHRCTSRHGKDLRTLWTS